MSSSKLAGDSFLDALGLQAVRSVMCFMGCIWSGLWVRVVRARSPFIGQFELREFIEKWRLQIGTY